MQIQHVLIYKGFKPSKLHTQKTLSSVNKKISLTQTICLKKMTISGSDEHFWIDLHRELL